jgi:hypothetical protein
MMIKGIYSRYNQLYETEYPSVEDANKSLCAAEDNCELYAIAIIDCGSNAIYFSDNNDIAGKAKEDVIKAKTASLIALGYMVGIYQIKTISRV